MEWSCPIVLSVRTKRYDRNEKENMSLWCSDCHNANARKKALGWWLGRSHRSMCQSGSRNGEFLFSGTFMKFGLLLDLWKSWIKRKKEEFLLVCPVSRNFSTRLTWSQSPEIDSTWVVFRLEIDLGNILIRIAQCLFLVRDLFPNASANFDETLHALRIYPKNGFGTTGTSGYSRPFSSPFQFLSASYC